MKQLNINNYQEIRDRLLSINSFGILRKLMSSDEIRVANILVKEKLMIKGLSDDNKHSVQYWVND